MRVVIYGAGDVAASGVSDILRRREGSFRMLGFIVEDPAMERAHMLPADRAHATTHPLLRRRLEALGVSDLLPPAPAAA